MKAYEIIGYVNGPEAYCVDCYGPELGEEEEHPIFAGDDIDGMICGDCGEPIDPDCELEEEPDVEGGDYISTDGGTSWYQFGNLVLTVGDDQECEDALRDHMEECGFWSNAWNISDHGNAAKVSL